MPILKVENVSKVYGTHQALKKISFTVEKGEFIGVMGPSGSGKTTLLHLLGSIDQPSSGHISINGNKVAKLKKHDLANHRIKNIGFIFQDYNLLETMTLKENIILPLSIKGVEVENIEEKLRPLVRDLGITDVVHKYPYEVSGGQQQRAAACRALITDPSIILADEPTGNLDSNSSEDLLNLLTFINQEYEATILIVTHDVYAASYCQKILFIRDGEIAGELRSGENKQPFLDSIIDTMRRLGGKRI